MHARARASVMTSHDDPCSIPLGELVDLISYNEYFGWYYSLVFADQLKVKESTLRKLMFDLIPTIEITSAFDKPIHISERFEKRQLVL